MTAKTLQRLDALPAYTTNLLAADGLKWSGYEPVPTIGSDIDIRINGIGLARVVAYASYEGYLGLMAYPLNPPAWWTQQNGTPTPENAALVFGAEIRAVASAERA